MKKLLLITVLVVAVALLAFFSFSLSGQQTKEEDPGNYYQPSTELKNEFSEKPLPDPIDVVKRPTTTPTSSPLTSEPEPENDGKDTKTEPKQETKAPPAPEPKPQQSSSQPAPPPSPAPVVSQLFSPAASWYQDISQAPLAANSQAVINYLDSKGGWGTGQMRVDFSLDVLTANNRTPFKDFYPTSDFFYPDCDKAKVPVPAGGNLEGESGYRCTGDGDCHLIVWDRPNNKLYEMWWADFRDDDFYGGCLAVWKTNFNYGNVGRGPDCSSADAAGLPIAPLLFTADEVAAGSINHAIRFILPNDRIKHRAYVPPATHSTGVAKGGANSPAFGARLRLRSDFPVDSLPSRGAKVVARAMQKYGIILADGGQIALTGQSDRHTVNKWAGLLGSNDLKSIKVTDFEVLKSGAEIKYTGDCIRKNL